MKVIRQRSLAAVVMSLTLAAAAAACHAFLDPDDLIAGGVPGSDASSGQDGSTSGAPGTASDTGVPRCVPPLPAGAQLVALVNGPPGAVPACPTGYEATGQAGFGDIADGAFTCAATSCACGAATLDAGSVKCVNPELTHYSEATCTTKVGATSLSSGGVFSCPRITKSATATRAKLTATAQTTATGATNVCPPSGTSTPTKETPRVGLEVHVCRAAAPPSGTCNAGDLPAVSTSAGTACYVSASDTCEAPWREKRSYSQTPDFVDNRSCLCACALDPTSVRCGGGSVHRNPTAGTSCSSGDNVGDPNCRDIDEYGTTVRLAMPMEPVTTGATCTPSAAKQGSVEFTNAPSLHLCCLSECTVCRQAALAPGGACETTIKACIDDPACKAHYECQQTCSATANGACKSCPAPAPAAAALYEAISTCRSKACSSSKCRGNEDDD